MGFGLLLVGYFTATIMSLNVCGGAFAFVGYLLILLASKKLALYNRSFIYLLFASVILLILSSVIAVYDISALLHRNLITSTQIISDTTADMLLKTRLFLELGFTAILCFSIKSISTQTGAQKTVYSSVRNFVFYCIFFVLQCIVWMASAMNIEFLKEFSLNTLLPVWVVIIKLVCLILNCVMLFSCYSRICDVNDTEMSQKPSRFEFINRHREHTEAKQREYAEYRLEKFKKKNSKKKKK